MKSVIDVDFAKYDKLRDSLFDVKNRCMQLGLPVPNHVREIIHLIDLYRCDSLCGYYDDAFDDEKQLIAYLYGISTNDTQIKG